MLHSLYHITTLLIFFVNLRLFIMAEGNGFSLELVHKDTVDSPAVPPADIEKFRSLIQSSRSRDRWLRSSATVGTDGLNIRPTMVQEQFLYLVKLLIGGNIFLLGMDTGSNLVWTQSDPCDTCFPHDSPNYKPGESTTFKRLQTNNRLCAGVYAGCTYNIRYNLGAWYTRGVLATEEFSFSKRVGPGVEKFPIVFGSSNNNSIDMFQNRRRVSGIFGMGNGHTSFIAQVSNRVHGLFSFCLVPASAQGVNSFLRFGPDVVMIGNYQSTRLLRRWAYYLVRLDGVGANGERFGLPHDTFASGCLFDTGAPVTIMVRPAYDAIKNWLKNYFRRFNNLRPIDYQGYEMCYRMPANFDEFPSVELHFHGSATLSLGKDRLFYIFQDRKQFCVLMTPSEHQTVVGAMPLQNIHVVYDLRNEKVYFKPKHCARP